jgi:imidazolonepropionase-like amidohydrolase
MRLTALFFGTLALASAEVITIRASTILDGKGGIQHNVRLTIEGTKITRVEPAGKAPVTYDLGSLTLMPGWIDTHVHINGHFNKQGRADTRAKLPPSSPCESKAGPGQRFRADSPRCRAWAPKLTSHCAT